MKDVRVFGSPWSPRPSAWSWRRWGVIVAMAVLAGACSGETSQPASRETPEPLTTTTSQTPDVPPPLLEIPAEPLDTIVMLPAPATLSDAVLGWLENYPTYIDGSARMEAIYPGDDGPYAIVRFEAENRVLGPVSCFAVGPLGSAPISANWCVVPTELSSKEIAGWGSQLEPGNQEAHIVHSPDAEAVVFELSGGGAFVIRPNGSTVSYHQWVGESPIRMTVFWPDGTTSQEIMSR